MYLAAPLVQLLDGAGDTPPVRRAGHEVKGFPHGLVLPLGKHDDVLAARPGDDDLFLVVDHRIQGGRIVGPRLRTYSVRAPETTEDNRHHSANWDTLTDRGTRSSFFFFNPTPTEKPQF